MFVQTRSIMASKCISEPAQSWPPGVSPDSLDYSLQVGMIMASKVHLQSCSVTASNCISPNSVDHGLLLYLQTLSIPASKFPLSWPPSAAPNSLDHGFGEYFRIHWILIFSRTLNCSHALPAATVSNHSGLHSCGPGWNQTGDPCPGYNARRNRTDYLAPGCKPDWI